MIVETRESRAAAKTATAMAQEVVALTPMVRFVAPLRAAAPVCIRILNVLAGAVRHRIIRTAARITAAVARASHRALWMVTAILAADFGVGVALAPVSSG